MLVAVGGIMLWALAGRALTAINVLHDRNPEFVRLSGGGIRNAYTIRILNKHPDLRRFAISFTGPTGARLEVIGAARGDAGEVVEVGPDQSRELRAVVSLDHAPATAAQPITFGATGLGDVGTVRVQDNFFGPRPEGTAR